MDGNIVIVSGATAQLSTQIQMESAINSLTSMSAYISTFYDIDIGDESFIIKYPPKYIRIESNDFNFEVEYEPKSILTFLK